MHVTAENDDTSLCVDLVDIVLSSGKEDVLNAIIAGKNEWLREDLFWAYIIVVAWQGSPENLTEIGGSNDRRIKIMVRLIAGSAVVTSPCQSIGWATETVHGCRKEDGVQAKE